MWGGNGGNVCGMEIKQKRGHAKIVGATDYVIRVRIFVV